MDDKNFLNYAFNKALEGKTKTGKTLYRRLANNVKGRLRNPDKIRDRVEKMSVKQRTEVIARFAASDSKIITEYQRKNAFSENDKFIVEKIKESLPSTVGASKVAKLDRIEENILQGDFFKNEVPFSGNELAREDIPDKEEEGKKQIFVVQVTDKDEKKIPFSKKGDKLKRNPKDRNEFFKQWNKVRGYEVTADFSFVEDDKSVKYILKISSSDL